MKVSVCITAYNAEATVERAIESAANLDWANKEILVLDDCSTDGTFHIIQKIKAKFDINIFRNLHNCGPAFSRNRLIGIASGEFIVFLDDDDVSLPNRVKDQINLITKYERETGQNRILCYGTGKRFYPNNYEMHLQAIGSMNECPIGIQIVDYLLTNSKADNVFFGSGIPTCSLAARKSCLVSIGCFDPSFRRVEDADLAIRAGFNNFHFIGTETIILTQFATFSDDKSYDINLANELRIVEKYKDYLDQNGLYNYAKNWRILRYYHFKKQYFRFIALFVITFFQYPFLTTTRAIEAIPSRLKHELRAFK